MAKRPARDGYPKKRAAGSSSAAKSDRPKRPEQGELIEDRRIKALDDVGRKYAEIRDARIELNREESVLKELAKKLMHQYDKTIYKHGEIEIILSPGEEEIRVKVKPVPEVSGGPADETEPAGGDETQPGDSEPAGDEAKP